MATQALGGSGIAAKSQGLLGFVGNLALHTKIRGDLAHFASCGSLGELQFGTKESQTSFSATFLRDPLGSALISELVMTNGDSFSLACREIFSLTLLRDVSCSRSAACSRRLQKNRRLQHLHLPASIAELGLCSTICADQ